MENDNLSDKKKFWAAPNILIVDDIPANLKVLSDMLKGEGYKVRPVPSGILALQAAEKEKPDLVILDIMMPGMDGYEVCRQLKENRDLSDVPVIFVSALSETNDIVKALTFGGVDYLSKPFQAEEVKARVNTHLKIYRQSKELQEQSKELQELNATKDKFFSIIAHDLRDPVVAFMGLTEMMADDSQKNSAKFTPDEIKMLLVRMMNSSRKIFSLLENLLEWSLIQRGMISFTPELLNLSESVNESLAALSESAKIKEIEFTLNISEVLNVYADANMFSTIIRNLAANAVKFTPKGGKVIVSAKQEENSMVEIAVSDTGIGMSKKILGRLFRLDINTGRHGTEGESGTGLGLLLCKDFVEKNGGKIYVDSEEGKGSTFRFILNADSLQP